MLNIYKYHDFSYDVFISNLLRHTQECVTCCDTSYCNELVVTNREDATRQSFSASATPTQFHRLLAILCLLNPILVLFSRSQVA